MRINFLLLMSMIVMVSACAPVASYKPYGAGSAFTGESAMGYKETQIEKGKWFVQYIATSSDSETDMVKFAVRRANEVGQNQCHGAYTKSDPTLNSDTTQDVGNLLLTTKSANLTVTCR